MLSLLWFKMHQNDTTDLRPKTFHFWDNCFQKYTKANWFARYKVRNENLQAICSNSHNQISENLVMLQSVGRKLLSPASVFFIRACHLGINSITELYKMLPKVFDNVLAEIVHFCLCSFSCLSPKTSSDQKIFPLVLWNSWNSSDGHWCHSQDVWSQTK